MATRKTGKTLDEYLAEGRTKADEQLGQLTTQQRASVDEAIDNNAATIDKQVAATTGKLQQSIDSADKQYRDQYDTNAIAQLVNQKKLKENMANMGLTDSGLNRTQQTALTVQRGNADAATRRQQQAYVDQLQKAIDEAFTAGEARKANYEIEANANYNEWVNDTMAALHQTADTNATNLYNQQEAGYDAQYTADVEAETAADQRKLELEKWMVENDVYEGDDGKLYKKAVKTDDVAELATALYKINGDWDRSVKMAKELLSGGNAEEQGSSALEDAAAAVNAAKTAGVNLSSLTKVYGGGTGFGDLFTTSADDKEHALGGGWTVDNWEKSLKRARDQAMDKLATAALTAEQKELVVAVAIGKTYYGDYDQETRKRILDAATTYFSDDAVQVLSSNIYPPE